MYVAEHVLLILGLLLIYLIIWVTIGWQEVKELEKQLNLCFDACEKFHQRIELLSQENLTLKEELQGFPARDEKGRFHARQ